MLLKQKAGVTVTEVSVFIFRLMIRILWQDIEDHELEFFVD